ncbi:unnamed protein product [Rhizopus stolonifer]
MSNNQETLNSYIATVAEDTMMSDSQNLPVANDSPEPDARTISVASNNIISFANSAHRMNDLVSCLVRENKSLMRGHLEAIKSTHATVITLVNDSTVSKHNLSNISYKERFLVLSGLPAFQ